MVGNKNEIGVNLKRKKVIKGLLNEVDKLIDLDLERAKSSLSRVGFSDEELLEHGIEISYLKNRIRERELYLSLSDEDRNVMDLFMKEGNTFFSQKKYKESLGCYKTASTITFHPIFQYYIGKVYYKMKDFRMAYLYLSNYEKNGGSKMVETLFYLWTMDDNKKRYELIKQRADKIDALTDMFDVYSGWKKIDYTRRLNFDSGSKDFDNIKHKSSFYIEVSEEEFSSRKLDVKDYYNYDISEKLEIIKELYISGKCKTADKLLAELEREKYDGSVKSMISGLRKNRKLYLNKSKRSG